MRLDLIEVKQEKTKTKIKVLIILLIAIFLIAIFSLLGIFCAKKYNNLKIKNYYLSLKNNQSINSKSESESENSPKEDNTEEVLANDRLPNYSKEAKNQLDNIYNNDNKIAYLTFDDGPSKTVTPLILDLLNKNNIKATFFVLGSRVEKNAEIVKREYEEGHYIANHGYSHNYSKIYSNANNVIKEYKKTEECIKKAIENENYNSYLFRFPGGSTGGKYSKTKKEAAKLLEEKNIAYIDWNALTEDAVGTPTKESIIKKLKSTVKNKKSVVILMHDSSDKILTYETLPDIINYLKEEGYTFDNFYNIMK